MARKLPKALQAVVEARRARFRELCKKIDAMSETERAALAAKMLVTTIEGHTLSMYNQMLVASQRPDVTLVDGYRQWSKAGRFVRKGEHGMMIWCTTSRKAGPEEKSEGAEGEEAKPGFIMGTVFDVSQTEPMPTPEAFAETKAQDA